MRFENIDRVDGAEADPVSGTVVYAPVKSLFLLTMYGATIYGFVRYLRIDAVLLFTVKTMVVLLLGHSVGMHRRLIHKSFECPLWLERTLVYFGVLVGLGGPFAMIRTHDFRDWAQRQGRCHDYFAHRRTPVIDAVWQMHCDLRLAKPPRLTIEPEVANDAFYRFIDRHWIAVHLPWALAFYFIGGWAWVIWGVCTQIATTVTGHWLIGYFAHQAHDDNWQVTGAGVQGRNVPLVGWLTMGEGWHNNHHAFPGSARMGLYTGQSDPGYRFIKMLEAMGLAWKVRTARDLAHRPQLQWTSGAQPHFKPDIKPCPTLHWIGRRLRFRI
ncbi:acyl-CoA desaturase [Asticcacaulis sp. AC466]|uniref:acyl-CoA desaturase n=1 Tax=Asticcacaulis sp. AC466 TaxID=1282362 RepID=UPI000418A5F3|nr:acyl-CoA desaturase [Asticcacaulis sp. AC466]